MAVRQRCEMVAAVAVEDHDGDQRAMVEGGPGQLGHERIDEGLLGPAWARRLR